jgi:hypothetical protein
VNGQGNIVIGGGNIIADNEVGSIDLNQKFKNINPNFINPSFTNPIFTIPNTYNLPPLISQTKNEQNLFSAKN